MTHFIIRRLLLSIPVLFGIVLLVFVLARVIPGDPCVATYGEKATAAVCARVQRPLRPGQADPGAVRHLPRGAPDRATSGISIKFGRPVTDMLAGAPARDRRADDLRADLRLGLRRHPRPASRRCDATRPPTSARWSSPTSASRSRSSCWACSSRSSSRCCSRTRRSRCRHRAASRRACRVDPAGGRVGPRGLDRAAADDPRLLSNMYIFNGARDRPVGRCSPTRSGT